MSLPPPGLPPEVGARTRLKAVAAELAEQHNPKLQAALAFELGALTETRLGDPAQALDYYRKASGVDPTFRPALFASARLLEAARDDELLVRVLAQTVQASTSNRDRAGALVELGCLLEDRLGDPAGAHSAFERALSADPRCLHASLMREQALFVQNHRPEASVLIARRAGHTLDPRLRAALACEAARDLAADGDIDAAVETLLTALALPGLQLSTLLTLAELASRYGRPTVAARAFEDLGALLAGYAAGHTSAEQLDVATRFPDRGHARQAAAYYYRTAALLRADSTEHAQEALLAHERAAACVPADVLLGLELAAAYQSLDAVSAARARLNELLPRAGAREGAALHFELAELCERQGDAGAALAHLRAAHSTAPEAPAIIAVLEDRLLDAGALDELCELLLTRASKQSGAERNVALWRSALAADRGQDNTRALNLFEQLSSQVPAEEQPAVLRELHGVAQRGGSTQQLRAAAQRLLACDIAASERSALWRSCYEAALSEQDMDGARAGLKLIVNDPACENWAAHAAWLVGGLQGDPELLARAHAHLATIAMRGEDRAMAAAHVAGQARALLSAGDKEEAEHALRRVLELAPGHPYAVSLLERTLLARGETGEAITLLRESAELDHNARSQQAALLQAGQLAEASGDRELAGRSYDEAAQRDPQSFEAQWARLRFAERNADRARRLSALQALAAREAEQDRPGSAHLELGDALAARGDFQAAAKALSRAIESDGASFEAAASAVLLPRTAAADALRPRALSELAEQTSRQTRRALEHERLAELMHEDPAVARSLLAARDSDSPGEVLLSWLLQEDPAQRADALTALGGLRDEPAARAELLLHAQRCRVFAGEADDADALMHALGMLEDAPEALATAVALREALDAADDPETRVAAFSAWHALAPRTAADDVKAALARALLDAGDAQAALYLLNELVAASPHDPSMWEALRVAARLCGDFERVVVACDELARHAPPETQAALLEESAGVLQERLGRPLEAEQRLRVALERAPRSQAVFERLHDVLVDRENLDGLLTLLAQRIQHSGDAEEQRDLLYERARILRARGDKAGALACANELLASAPQHAGALGLCAEIHASNENWAEAVAVLRRLSETELTPAQKRLAIEGAADFLEDKLGDEAGAYRELEKLVTLELADFAALVHMASLAESAGLVEPAAKAFARAAAQSRGVQCANLERRAAGLWLSLERSELACAALRRALLAHPQDEQAFTMLFVNLRDGAERARLTQDFLDALWQALASEPTEPDLLRALARVGRLSRQPVLTQLALFVLEASAQATTEEHAEGHTLRAGLPDMARGPLREDDLHKLIPRELRPELLALARELCTALIELKPDSPELRGLPRRMRIAKGEVHAARDHMLRFLPVFGLELGELYIDVNGGSGLSPLAAEGTTLTWVVGPALQWPLRRADGVRLLRLMAAARAHLLPIAGDDSPVVRAKLAVPLLAAGILELRPDAAHGPVAREAAQLAPRLTRMRREALQLTAARVPDLQEALAEIARGSAAFELRAALVGCGDLVSVAGSLIDAGTPSLKAVLATPAGRELLRFWLSPACAELLRALGTSA